MNKEIVIVSAVRTAIGSFGGKLASVPAAELGAIAVKEALARAGVKAGDVDEVLMGCVIQAGLGQNVARQCLIKAGLPVEIPAMTINKVCGSGLRCVNLAAALIAAGEADVVVAGGTENMSLAPFALPQARYGYRMGNGKIVDMMVNDGLWDVFNKYHMGITAENVVEQWGLTREELDAFAASSQQKAEAAIKAGKFKDEILPIEVKERKSSFIFDQDEHMKEGTTLEGLAKLRPVFKKDGTVTPGNASGMNDGASAVVVMSEEKAQEKGVKPLVRIVSTAVAGVDPSVMGLGPVPSSKLALERAGLTMDDIDLFELNEAFAAQSLGVLIELGLEPGTKGYERVNVNGGAVAHGHALGNSGTRILTTLIYEMKRRNVQYGLATLCIGGGQGITAIVENV